MSRALIHLPSNRFEQAADRVTAFAGSWWFLGVHVLWWGPWIIFQVEPFPYGLLTMILSLEAIVLSTVIMISQNRQAAKDRLRDDRDDIELGDVLAINRKQTDHDEWTREFLNAFAAYMLNPTKESEKSLKELL